MDKYEYKVRADEINRLIGEGDYAQAADIADTIDWRRVKSVMMLCTVSDLYKINRRYEDAKNMLLLAYERRPGGRTICYSLCELCIKTEDFLQAVNYYKEFVHVAPRDPGRYILQYKIYEAQEVSLEERIGVLEELKKRDYREKWAYELAYLYHRVGLATRCVEECDELILWFGSGKYVIKAMELKMLHEPLTAAQQEAYDHRFEAYGQESGPESRDGEQLAAGSEEGEPGEAGEGDSPEEYGSANGQEEAFSGEEGYAQSGYREYEDRGYDGQETVSESRGTGNGPEEEEELDIQVKTMDMGKFNTINLQEELAAGLQEVLGAEYGEENGQGAGTPEEPEDRPAVEVFFGETGEMVEEEEEAVPELLGESGLSAESSVKSVLPSPEPPVSESPAREETGERVMAQMREESVREESEGTCSGENGSVQPPAELAGVLSQEANGQIRLVMPEKAAVEKQITGQMKIEDILAEWERMKKESQEKCREEVRRHVLRQTGPMFTEFEAAVRDGLLGQLEEAENGQFGKEAGSGKPSESKEPEGLPEEEGEYTGYEEEPEEEAEYTGYEEEPEEPGAGDSYEGEEIEDIGDIGEPEEEGEYTGYEEEPGEPGAGDSYEGEEVEDIGDIGEPGGEPEGEAEYAGYEEEPEEEGEYAGYEEEPGEPGTGDSYEGEEVEDIGDIGEPAGEPEGEAEYAGYEEEPEEEGEYAGYEAESEEPGAGDSGQEALWDSDGGELPDYGQQEEDGDFEEEYMDFGESDGYFTAAADETAEKGLSEEGISEDKNAPGEEPAEESPPEAEDDFELEPEPERQTGKKKARKALKAGAGKKKAAGEENRASEEADKDREPAEEKEEKQPIERDKAKIRALTREEKELYAPFIQSRRSREQLVKAIDNISMAAYTGNVVITGEEGMDTLTLAKNMIREVQMADSNFSGKAAKISGRDLNRRDVRATLEEMNGGALIIYTASGMTAETAKALYRSLQQERLGIIVVLEDTKKAIQKLFLGTPELTGAFTARMDVEALSNDTLVLFGKRYAREMEYSIDDLGILALHTRIEELQTIDHVATVVDVKRIVDEAIRHANRKTLGHFFDILFAKRYDDEDMIVLTEKDFVV